MAKCLTCNNTGYVNPEYFYSHKNEYDYYYNRNYEYTYQPILYKIDEQSSEQCFNCMACKYCYNRALITGNSFLTKYKCNSCNIIYSDSIIEMLKKYDSSDKVILYSNGKSLIKWTFNKKTISIKCNDQPKHPSQLISFVNKHLKSLILK